MIARTVSASAKKSRHLYAAALDENAAAYRADAKASVKNEERETYLAWAKIAETKAAALWAELKAEGLA